MTRQIILPHNGWKPRPYQRPLWNYLSSGGLRALAVWHRRAGKDDVMLHHAACAVMERPANYWHMLPEFGQCRRAIWDAVSAHTGKRRIFEAFPQELIDGEPNATEMKIRFKNGSTWQLVGSDRYDALVGAGVAGVCFSEFALANPSAWGYIRPMVAENKGWATFISTPRGRNHFKDLYDMAKASDGWFAERLAITDTGALSPADVAESLAEYIAIYGEDIGRAMFQQEYEVSFNAAILGAFYAREMATVRAEGRITDEIEAVEGKPVHRAWDIGVKDDTSIWWFQVVGGQVRVLDCYSKPGVSDIDEFAALIAQRAEAHGWMDGIDFVPHDARQRTWGMKKGRLETMQEAGLNPHVVANLSKLDGINAVRRTLPRCVFHTRCEESGIPALEQYRREWDDERKTFKANEVHDWSSHASDAFRYLAIAWREIPDIAPSPDPHVTRTTGDIMAPKLY